MPPTNVYDVTQPPDTQLANLLGQDLRNLALNVQQRMALLSGTAAGIWNPALDAQPLNWTGLLYFATDTGQAFQWSGAAWIDVTTPLFLRTLLRSASVSLTVQNAPIATTTLYAVPGGAGGLYRVSADLITSFAGGAGLINTELLWNNGAGAQAGFLTNLDVTSVGAESSGVLAFYAASGTNIQFNTQFNGVSGTPQYSCSLRLEYLG